MKNETKQTAVEWFAEKIRNYKTPLNMAELEFILIHNDMINRFEQQAKEMEKEQMMECYLKADVFPRKYEFEKWYNETYGGNK